MTILNFIFRQYKFLGRNLKRDSFCLSELSKFPLFIYNCIWLRDTLFFLSSFDPKLFRFFVVIPRSSLPSVLRSDRQRHRPSIRERMKR